ncbi:hypothetical protein [Halorubrum sp. FL23]|uniref:hypothetical protein n=1 Tax=Halorubrum sp. FL23 TaxID=3458704 RepID=UPI004034159F
MPQRRKLLKGIAAGTGVLSYSGLATAAKGDQVKSETLANNEKYQDIYVTNGKESIEVRYYKKRNELVFISTPEEPNKLKGKQVRPDDLPMPDPPSLVDRWDNRTDKIGSDCEVVGISDHYFTGADIELTSAGTNVAAGVLAGLFCQLAVKHPLVSTACTIGGPIFSWLFLGGYGIEGEGTVGFMDVDEGQWIYTEQTGSVYVDIPSVAVVGAPYADATADELEFFKLIADLSNFDLPQVEPMHIEPLLDHL